MTFDEKYKLLELAEDEGAKAFVALETQTGRKVTVFLFVGEQAHAQAELIDRLRGADRQQFPELIEVGDNRGTPYVVTQPFGGFAELKSRIAHRESASPAPPPHKPPEFSKVGVWRVPPALQSDQGHAQKHPDEHLSADKQQPVQPAAQHTPGSFTQMFQSSAPPMGESVPEVPKAQPPSPVAPSPAPGSFTQMFHTAAPPIGEPVPEVPKAPPPSPAAPPPAQPTAGSFTQMFQASAPPIGEPKPEIPKAPQPPPVAPPPAQPTPGSFTQMFQAAAPPIGEPKAEVPKPPLPHSPKAPPAAKPAPGEFTQMFQTAAPPIGEPKPVIPKVPTPPPVTPQPAQPAPGEFTRFFKGASTPSAVPTPLPKNPEAQGDFARIFGSGDRVTSGPSTGTSMFDQSSSAPLTQGKSESASIPATPKAYTPPSGEFTRIFGGTSMESSTVGPMVPAPPSAAPPQPAAPGEYTRMFGAQSIPQGPATQPEPAPTSTPESPAPAKQTSKLLVPVLIGVILLLFVAIAVIVITRK